jgi:chorismate mutase
LISFAYQIRKPAHLNLKKLAIVLALWVSVPRVIWAQESEDPFRPLVETSARRLRIAEQVALSKWDSGASVEDASREAQVIEGAVRDGKEKNLSPSSVSAFFKAQIEANKMVQYSFLADWNRTGKAPAHSPIDLVKTIRPEIDEIQRTLIAELAETSVFRAKATCRSEIAKSVGKYSSAHRSEITALRRAALDRALAATCLE